VFARLVGDGEAPQHAGNLFGAGGPLEGGDLCARGRAIGEFGDPQMPITERRHLRQVRDAEHLCSRAEGCEFAADDFGDRATNARVDFVEHHAHALRGLVAAYQSHLHGKRKARQFTA